MLVADWFAVSVKFGAAVIVITRGSDLMRPPPVATTLIVYFPGGVEVDGSKVSVLVPAPGAAKPAGAKLPVIPIGRPLNDKLVTALNVPTSASVTPTVTGDACTIERALLATVKFKLGGTINVSGTVSV